MLDGNFQMGEYQKTTVSSHLDKLAGRSLVNGRSYIPHPDTLRNFLLKMPDTDEVSFYLLCCAVDLIPLCWQKSVCNFLKAVNKQNIKKFKSMKITGVVQCCCDHIFIWSCVDLQKGER